MTKKEKESLAEGIAELKGNIDKAFSAENEVSDKLMVLFNEASEKGDVELARRLGEIIVRAISLKLDEPWTWTSLVSIRASSPRPFPEPMLSSPRPRTLRSYFFLTAIGFICFYG